MRNDASLPPLFLALLAAASFRAPAQTAESAASVPPIFSERAAEVGLDFVHTNGMSGKLYFCEMMGGGGALVDYDNDGDLDVYLVQGRPLDREPEPGEDFRDRLYRNELVPGGDLRFVDVTAESGLVASAGYGMGVASGDFDNDGWVDLYVTELGGNRLLRNDGGGGERPVTFTDVTAAAGADDPGWSVSASFFDFDRDGWLDLFVVNYVNFTLRSHKVCRSYTGAPDYCSPLAYRPVPDSLFKNRGRSDGPGDGPPDVTFGAISAQSGIRREFGAGLGVVASDFDGDGWADLYVANDQSANQMWINQRDGTFHNEALMAGTALNSDGRPEAGMGVAAGDVDGDGDLDLLVSHLVRETNTLYLNDGAGAFEDRTVASGLGQPSWARPASAWLGSTMTTTAGSTSSPPTARSSTSRSWCAAATPTLCTSPTSCSTTSAAPGSRRSPPAPESPWHFPRSAAAPRPATSTTTATRTCWWSTTTARRGCWSTKSASAGPGSACACSLRRAATPSGRWSG